MTIIYKCDRCGKELKDSGDISRIDIVDFCKECAIKWTDIKGKCLKEFMTGDDENNKQERRTKRVSK